MRQLQRSLLAMSGVFIIMGCSLTACQPKTQSGTATIFIKGEHGGAYAPSDVSVTLGTIVTWVNEDSQPHTATAVGAFDSGPIPPNGGRWAWVASIAGTFTYHSLIQPNMAGKITVVVPAPTY